MNLSWLLLVGGSVVIFSCASFRCLRKGKWGTELVSAEPGEDGRRARACMGLLLGGAPSSRSSAAPAPGAWVGPAASSV